MADNLAVTAGSGTTISADDIGGGVLQQRVKVTWGPDGTGNDTDVASGKPMPVQHRVSDGTAWTYGAGAVGTGTPRVILASDSPPGTGAYSASATFTPAASSHTAGDCNGAAAEIDFNAPSGAHLMINSLSFEIDGGTAEASAWRLHLYNVTPPSATADDGAWDLSSGDRTAYLGQIDIGTAVDQGATQWIEVNGIGKQIKLSGDSVFAYLVNLTTVTPANVAHKVTLLATLL